MRGVWNVRCFATPLGRHVRNAVQVLVFFDFCGNVLESTREYDAKSWGVSSFVCLRQMQSDGFVFLQPYSCVNFNRIVQWVLSLPNIKHIFQAKQTSSRPFKIWINCFFHHVCTRNTCGIVVAIRVYWLVNCNNFVVSSCLDFLSFYWDSFTA